MCVTHSCINNFNPVFSFLICKRDNDKLTLWVAVRRGSVYLITFYKFSKDTGIHAVHAIVYTLSVANDVQLI